MIFNSRLIGLLAFGAALFCSTKGSAQLLNKAHKLVFYNQANYHVQFNIDAGYYTSGARQWMPVKKSTKILTLGQSEAVSLPSGYRINSIQGVLFFPNNPDLESQIFKKSYKTQEQLPACFKTYGALFDPKWNNLCE